MIRKVEKRIIDKMVRILAKTYPGANVELVYHTPFQLLIATILSAQTTDVTVNAVTKSLFQQYGTSKKLARAEITTIEKLIHPTGFFHQKAKAITRTAQAIENTFHGRVPRSMTELVSLPGVARKTANVVLGNAFGINEGIVVDTHVKRLSQRLGMTRETTPEKIERDLMKKIPKSMWTLFAHLLIWHGRRQCTAKKPMCVTCPLKSVCPSASRYMAASRL